MYVWFVSNAVVCVEFINADRYLDILILNIAFIIGWLIKQEIFQYATIYESLTWVDQNHLDVIIFSCIHFHFI